MRSLRKDPPHHTTSAANGRRRTRSALVRRAAADDHAQGPLPEHDLHVRRHVDLLRRPVRSGLDERLGRAVLPRLPTEPEQNPQNRRGRRAEVDRSSLREKRISILGRRQASVHGSAEFTLKRVPKAPCGTFEHLRSTSRGPWAGSAMLFKLSVTWSSKHLLSVKIWPRGSREAQLGVCCSLSEFAAGPRGRRVASNPRASRGSRAS